MRHVGQLLAEMQGSDMSSKFGDIWLTPERPEDWRDDLVLAEAMKLVPWWAKKTAISARYRPEERPPGASGNPYNNGTLTVLYGLPGQWLGPYLTKSRRMVDGEYFRLAFPKEHPITNK